LLLDIRTASDAGTPIAAEGRGDSEAAKAYAALARSVWESVSKPVAAGPRIVIE